MTILITKDIQLRSCLILATVLLLFIQSCTNKQAYSNLKAGDILFQDLNCGGLCDAIEAVTEGVEGRDFSHCGLIVNHQDTLKVIEAIGKKVQLTSIDSFFKRSGDTARVKNITVGRLKEEHQVFIEGASAFAFQQLNQPYDDVFLLNNSQWYCSELIYESFKKASKDESFFEVYPMTFKESKNGNFFAAWVAYYKKLGREIPEGKLGISPGSISLSDKIRIINYQLAEQ